MRLFQKKIWDVEEIKKEEEGEDEENENEGLEINQLEKNEKNDNETEYESKNIFKNRKTFISWITEEKILKSVSISYLRIIALGIHN